MAIIPVPASFGFSKINSFKLQRAGNQLRSKYTGQGQRIVFPYAVWMLDADLLEQVGLNAGDVRSFLVQLEGFKNTFRLPVPGFSRPMTGYGGNALANGAVAARASSMPVDGLNHSVAVLGNGDYFTVNDELKMVTAPVASSATGQAVLDFKPALRKPIVDNTAVTFQNPTILMTAVDTDVADWAIGPPVRQSAKFQAIEAVEI